LPILLLLIAVLAGGSAYADDMGHIADVIHPNQRTAKTRPTATAVPLAFTQAPASEPAPVQTARPTESPQPPPEPGPEPETSSETPAPQDEWVVQVAAFDNHAAAATGVERIGHADLRIAYTYRNGEDWYVLLLGPYANRGQAERAGEAFTKSTGGDYWVRPASAVRPPQN